MIPNSMMTYRCVKLSRWDTIGSILANYFEGHNAFSEELATLSEQLCNQTLHCLADELSWHVDLPHDVKFIVVEEDRDVERLSLEVSHPGYCCMICGEEFTRDKHNYNDMVGHVTLEHEDFLDDNKPCFEPKDLILPINYVSFEDWRFLEIVEEWKVKEGITKHYLVEVEQLTGPVCPIART